MRKVIVTAAMIAIAVVIVAAASCGGSGRSAPVGVNLSGNATPPTATQTLPGDSATPVAGIPQEAPKSAPTVVGDDGKVSPPPPSPDNPPDDQEPTDESDSEPGVLAPGTEVPVANDVGTTGTTHPTVSPLTPAGSESGSQSAQEPPEWQSIWQAPDTLNRYLIVEGFARVMIRHDTRTELIWGWNVIDIGWKKQYGYELLGLFENPSADPPYYDADIKLPPEMTFAEAYELLPQQLTGVMSVRPWIVEKLESSQIGSSQMPSWGDALNSADGGEWRAGLPYRWLDCWYWFPYIPEVPYWQRTGSIIIIQFQGEDWPAPSHERVDVDYWEARVRELGDVIPDLERRGFVQIFPMVYAPFGAAMMVMPPGWTLPEAQYRLPKEYYPWIKAVYSGS